MIETTQHGYRVWTTAQARARFGRNGMALAVRTGLLTQPWRGVLIRATDRGDPPTMAAAALLAAGPEAALSGPTAARMYGCTALDSPRVHVTVPYTRWIRTRGGLVVHHDRFGPDDVVELDGLRVMVLDYVLAEILCSQPESVAMDCVEEAFAELAPSLHAELRNRIRTRLQRRDDRRGTNTAALLLDLTDPLPTAQPDPAFTAAAVGAADVARQDVAPPDVSSADANSDGVIAAGVIPAGTSAESVVPQGNGLEDVAGFVGAPDVAQGGAHLADGGAGGEGATHRVQQVAVAGG